MGHVDEEPCCSSGQGGLQLISNGSAMNSGTSTKLCEVCNAVPPKYCCPGCKQRTCSLSCSKKHKEASGCTGKRDRLAFVALKEFDDRTLLSDFRVLEEVQRTADVAYRCRPPFAKSQLPGGLAALVNAARARRVRLLLMPPGMQKRKANTTRYDGRSRRMLWRVEWLFPSAGDSMSLVNDRVPEDAALKDVLQAHLQYQPGTAAKHIQLHKYAGTGCDQLKVFMRKEQTPANERSYYAIDLQQPLGSQLAGKTVIEFPVFMVAFPSEAHKYPLAPELPTPYAPSRPTNPAAASNNPRTPGRQQFKPHRPTMGSAAGPQQQQQQHQGATALAHPCLSAVAQGEPSCSNTAQRPTTQPTQPHQGSAQLIRPPTAVPPPRPPPGPPPTAAVATPRPPSGLPPTAVPPPRPPPGLPPSKLQPTMQPANSLDNEPAAKRPCLGSELSQSTKAAGSATPAGGANPAGPPAQHPPLEGTTAPAAACFATDDANELLLDDPDAMNDALPTCSMAAPPASADVAVPESLADDNEIALEDS